MSNIITVLTKEIQIATEQFQFRVEPFNSEKVDWMVSNWNPDLLDPLDLWVDEHGGKWLISGHHRLAALRKLEIETTSARLHQTDISQARMLAMASNANRLQYTPIEYCRCLRFLVDEQGLSKTAAAEKLAISAALAAKYYALRHLQDTDWESHLHLPTIASLGYEVGLLCERHPCSLTELNHILKLILTHDLRLPQVVRLVNDLRQIKSAPVESEQNSLFDLTVYSTDRVAYVVNERTYYDKIWQRVWFIYKLLDNPPNNCTPIPAEFADPLRKELRRLNSYLTGSDQPESVPQYGKKNLRTDFAESFPSQDSL